MVSETLRGSTPIAFSFNFDQFRIPKLFQNPKKNEAQKHVDFPFHCGRIFLYFGKLFRGILCSDGKAKMSFSSRRNASFHIFGLSETRLENMWRTNRIKVSFLVDLRVSFQRCFLEKRVRKLCFIVAAVWWGGREIQRPKIERAGAPDRGRGEVNLSP